MIGAGHSFTPAAMTSGVLLSLDRMGAVRQVDAERGRVTVDAGITLRALARVDPFPEIAGPAPPVGEPDSRVLRDPDIRRALPSVVRILGTACGLGVAGSGWIAIDKSNSSQYPF